VGMGFAKVAKSEVDVYSRHGSLSLLVAV
jgi:hypothetical protein